MKKLTFISKLGNVSKVCSQVKPGVLTLNCPHVIGKVAFYIEASLIIKDLQEGL